MQGGETGAKLACTEVAMIILRTDAAMKGAEAALQACARAPEIGEKP
jgi:hypothetical protein